jgi:pimeloyl-ACP methyl ester carboxylesterase
VVLRARADACEVTRVRGAGRRPPRPWREQSAPLGDLRDDAQALRDQLDSLETPVVLLGHSYGGVVITDAAADHPNVRHLVFLCAFMPDENETLLDLVQTAADDPSSVALRRGMIVHDDGTTTIDPAAAAALFFHDCPPRTADWAAGRLEPDTLSSAMQRPSRVAWRNTPSTYVVSTDDKALAPSLQRRLADRAGEKIEWPTSHSPFLSRPDLVVELLERLAGPA